MRYFRRGTSKIVFLPVVAGASPTRPEIVAGTMLTPQVAEVSGFSFENSPINTPDLDTTFTSTIAGEDTASDSSLTLYDDTASVVLRNLLVKGTAGYIVLFPLGDVPTKRCEIWPVQSTGVADEWSAGNDPARFKVQFGVTAIPKLAAVVPA